MDINLQIPEDFYKEEVRSGYTVSEKMKKVWAVELDLLAVFQKICEKHGLKYWASGGTLLGAARHNGFIPWDNDIDIQMPRNDYEIFCKIAQDELSYPYFLQTSETDIGYGKTFARIRNSETTVFPESGLLTNINFRYNQGIFIDIFPMDNVPDEDKERRNYLRQVEKLKKRVGHFSTLFDNYTPGYFMAKQGLKKAGVVIGALFQPFYHLFKLKNPYIEQYRDLATKYNDKKTKRFGILLFCDRKSKRPECTILEYKDFKETEYLDFEMLKLPVPAGYDNCLRQQYGDWQTPVQAGSYHGSIKFDPDTPYKQYYNRLKK